MKKVLAVLAVLVMTVTVNAGVIMTGLMDGPYSGGHPKAVELYISGTEDLSGWSVKAYNNGSTSNNGGNTALSGTYTDEFVYVIYTGGDDEFKLVWGGDKKIITGGAPNVNGDDAIVLYNGSTQVDVFGIVGVDGTGKNWEYLDSYAYRISGTLADGSFNVCNWTVGAVDALDGKSGTGVAAIVPFGTYQVPEPATMVLLGLGSVLFRFRRK